MSFQVPYESSPPSTPDKSRSLFSNVSTTPAGAPPSKANSFTPFGPPPSTVFGSSQLGSRNSDSPGSLFTKSGNMNNDSIFGSSFGPSDPAPRSKKGAPLKSFASQSIDLMNGTPFGSSVNFGPSDSFASSKMSEDVWQDVADEEASEEADEMETEETNGQSNNRFSFLDSHLDDSLPPRPITALGHRKSPYPSPASVKRPKLDERVHPSPLRRVKLSPKKSSPMSSIVRNFASRSVPAAVDDPGDMIIRTEDEIYRMYDEFNQAEYKDVDDNLTLSETATNLAAIWKLCAERIGTSRPFGTGATVGPGESAPNAVKAAFLGSLLFHLHHPPAKPEGLSNSTGQVAPQSLIRAGSRTYSPIPMPKILLEWLDNNHTPQSGDLQELKESEPNPTASPNFWEIINSGVLRGRFSEVAEILRSADFNYARSALEDGLVQTGYRGTQLQNIQRCVNKLNQILESCPGFQYDNWDIKSAEWSLYRKRVVAAVEDLEEFAESEEQPAENPGNANRFQAVNFGLGPTPGQQNLSFTQSARMAESRVPWAIYQNLKSIYRIILGDIVTITTHAQDWVEATIGLTVWWDGENDGDTPTQELGASAANFKRSRISKQTMGAIDDDPTEAYLQRLGLAYSNATSDAPDDAGFRVNSLNSLEVGLASVFEGDVEGVLELLQTWSLCVASAVAEVSSAGGWFGSSDARGFPGLNEDDLMVLSYGQNDSARSNRVRKDDILDTYASALSERPSIEYERGAKEGWEVGLGVLSRLDDPERMQKSVSEVLDKLPLETSAQMDKVVLLCGELGLEDEGRKVAEVLILSVLVQLETDGSSDMATMSCPKRRRTALHWCATHGPITDVKSSRWLTFSSPTASFSPARIQASRTLTTTSEPWLPSQRCTSPGSLMSTKKLLVSFNSTSADTRRFGASMKSGMRPLG